MTRNEKAGVWISCVSIVISLASVALSVVNARLLREADEAKDRRERFAQCVSRVDLEVCLRVAGELGWDFP